MAQPKNRGRRDEGEKSPERKELENLEKKTSMFVEKRNQFNDQARLAREERDLLNDKRKELFENINKLKAERDGHNAKLREHKEKRNEYQKQAKLLIAKRRGDMKKAQDATSPSLRAKELQAEIQDLEFQQETSVLTTKNENKLIETIRKKRVELEGLKREVSKLARIEVDLADKDKAIDQLFALAEQEHQEVLKYYKLAQEAHDRFMKAFQDASTVIAQANAKHAEFVDLKQKADAEHQHFLELRSKILELRGKDFAERNEARAIIKEQRKKVAEAVADPKKLDEVAESTLEQLKKGGKIRLG